MVRSDNLYSVDSRPVETVHAWYLLRYHAVMQYTALVLESTSTCSGARARDRKCDAKGQVEVKTMNALEFAALKVRWGQTLENIGRNCSRAPVWSTF